MKSADGQCLRQEQSPLQTFGIKLFNLSLDGIFYDKDVEDQIQSQRKVYLETQNAIVEAKKAEQSAFTAAKQGEAQAAIAKWAQEAKKATAVTLAQQELEVAELQRQKAEKVKQTAILEGEGEATKKRLIMEADGALQQKLTTYSTIMQRAFVELGKQKWVPDTMIVSGGGQGSQGAGNAAAFMDILTTKALKDLNLDMSMSGGKK